MPTPAQREIPPEKALPLCSEKASGLLRRLGLFDATMLVMGGIIGTGIFVVPQLVAQQVHSAASMMAVWLTGGCVAICGALVYAELTARYPEVGGQYTYLREAYHPIIAFLFGWGLLLVMQTGAVASVAIVFARYFMDMVRLPVSEGIVAGGAIAILTLVNCFGVRTGSTVQNVFMVSKIAVIGLLVGAGLYYGNRTSPHVIAVPHSTNNLLIDGSAALVPVLFTYSGWQAAGFMSGEVRNPRRNMPLATVLGVIGVITLYCLVNLVDVWVLGADRLASSNAPASAVMWFVLGSRGAAIISVGIMIAALGYISQASLTAPRVYYAMANDGVFFRGLAWLSPNSHVPVRAILLQGVFAIVIAFSGRYDQILNYVMSVEFSFFCLTGISIFIFRKRAARETQQAGAPSARSGRALYEMPGHPFTTILFVGICAAVSINMMIVNPMNNLIGMTLVLTGVPVFFMWKRTNRQRKDVAPTIAPASHSTSE